MLMIYGLSIYYATRLERMMNTVHMKVDHTLILAIVFLAFIRVLGNLFLIDVIALILVISIIVVAIIQGVSIINQINITEIPVAIGAAMLVVVFG